MDLVKLIVVHGGRVCLSEDGRARVEIYRVGLRCEGPEWLLAPLPSVAAVLGHEIGERNGWRCFEINPDELVVREVRGSGREGD